MLFRTAAKTFGLRVIGLILTAILRDGTLGLRAVREAGGITIAQNPEWAEAADMRRNATAGLNVDYCLQLPEIGPPLDLLVRRAGSNKQGVLETGPASAIRLLKEAGAPAREALPPVAQQPEGPGKILVIPGARASSPRFC